jgi:hypothetical protein
VQESEGCKGVSGLTLDSLEAGREFGVCLADASWLPEPVSQSPPYVSEKRGEVERVERSKT